jgi:hypothetical protein
MADQDVPARPPPLEGLDSVNNTTSPNLKSLLSPTQSDDPGTARPDPTVDDDWRSSVTPSDVGEVDVRFSNVPLSSAASVVTLRSEDSAESSSSRSRKERRNTVAFDFHTPRSPTLASGQSQKRPTSGSSVASAGSLPFMLQRLDMHKSTDERDRKSKRQSQMLIKEEFHRVHEKEVVTETTTSSAIDWGTCWLKSDMCVR